MIFMESILSNDFSSVSLAFYLPLYGALWTSVPPCDVASVMYAVLFSLSSDRATWTEMKVHTLKIFLDGLQMIWSSRLAISPHMSFSCCFHVGPSNVFCEKLLFVSSLFWTVGAHSFCFDSEPYVSAHIFSFIPVWVIFWIGSTVHLGSLLPVKIYIFCERK